ncbi:cellulase family glycosylhydrolase [Methyloversatilis sp. RAC08]|uniref:cellulase family glycosylhydrolase n=1 Tax=Methyloversatilis sp. RAC08 TaxID=1842540 RepID=UPI001CBCA096|nr:cellulase family glycosylhydrolase [Methyloversatilis sp. RAC08]
MFLRYLRGLAWLMAGLASQPLHAASLPPDCRAFGVNYFDVFSSLLANSTSTRTEDGFVELAAARVPFARFMATGFWPDELKLYSEDRDGYFRLMDRVFRAAENNGVGLIPSLFWNYSTVPDLVGEPVAKWGDPSSRTTAFARQYISDFVQRYKDSPVLWAYEFGNEMNLYVDLPNAAKLRPKTLPHKGTPEFRTAGDEITNEDLSVAYRIFVETVRKYDTRTLLSTGAGLPRKYAFNNAKSRSWKVDSEGEFRTMLGRHNPDDFGLLSFHVYPHHEHQYFGKASFGQLFDAIVSAAKHSGQLVFAGEFGASREVPAQRDAFEKLIHALDESGVNLAALWVYRFDYQSATFDVRPGGDTAWMLDRISAFNAQYAAKGRLCGLRN